MLDRDQMKAITDRVLAMSRADEASLEITGTNASNLRFARNSPSTSGNSDDMELTITSSFGDKSGSATVNQFDDDTLRRAVTRAEDIARLAPADPEHMPVLGPREYLAVDGYSKDTAENGAAALADAAALSIDNARAGGLVAAGFAESSAGFVCRATSAGLFGYHRQTSAYLSQTVRTGDAKGSGWASATSHQIRDIDAASVSQRAMAKARMSAGARELAPGKYPTILEPACVANLVAMLAFGMDARRADEGRSFFSKPGGGTRVGDKIFSDAVTIRSDPTDPSAPGLPWGEDGLEQAPRALVEGGVLRELITSRYWAQKTGQKPIPRPSNVLFGGGAGTVEDLVAQTERGVLVTSLWYIRPVDPKTMLFTGLTRDGVFWIENGKIAYPVQNFRWNDSPVSVLGKVLAMSRAERIPPRPWRASNFVVPALKISEFHFSSVSDAV